MLQYIKGTLIESDEESVTLDHNGLGFRIFVSGQTFQYLPAAGSEIKIYTYLQVKEDAFCLFGFLTKDELRIFKLLIGVSGVGPKGALAVLSVLSTDDLRFAVISDDAKAIAKAPGIGIKSAQRIVLELKDKLKLSDAFGASDDLVKNQSFAQEAGVRQEALLALSALGYSQTEAAQVLSGITITPDMDVESLLKLALRNMALI